MANKEILAVTPIQYTLKVQKLILTLKEQMKLISDRLRSNIGLKDSRAHMRAYQDLSKAVRVLLQHVPEGIEERKPEAMKKAVVGIPFTVKDDVVYMGCMRCDEWVDVSKVFSQQQFDGVYLCPNGHSVVFGGITK